MISVIFSPQEMLKHIAEQARTKRLALNFSQKTLAERAGVSWGTLKKFEQSGKISLDSLLKIAVVLDALPEFENLFKPVAANQLNSLDDLFKDKKRQRGRR